MSVTSDSNAESLLRNVEEADTNSKKKKKTMTYAKSKIGVVIHNYISN